MSLRPRRIVTKLLSDCDVQINGDAPYDIRVKNEEFYTRTLIKGSISLGESYMDGWWDAYRQPAGPRRVRALLMHHRHREAAAAH